MIVECCQTMKHWSASSEFLFGNSRTLSNNEVVIYIECLFLDNNRMLFNNEVEDDLDGGNTINTSNDSSSENATTHHANNVRGFDCMTH